MDNKRIKIWTPGSTRVAKLRLVRKTLEKGGSHLVTTVDNKTNGKAIVIEPEAKTNEMAEKLHKKYIKPRARGRKQKEQGKPEAQRKT